MSYSAIERLRETYWGNCWHRAGMEPSLEEWFSLGFTFRTVLSNQNMRKRPLFHFILRDAYWWLCVNNIIWAFSGDLWCPLHTVAKLPRRDHNLWSFADFWPCPISASVDPAARAGAVHLNDTPHAEQRLRRHFAMAGLDPSAASRWRGNIIFNYCKIK